MPDLDGVSLAPLLRGRARYVVTDLNPAMLGADSRGGVQSIQFLDYKKRVETQLNEALQKIRRR